MSKVVLGLSSVDTKQINFHASNQLAEHVRVVRHLPILSNTKLHMQEIGILCGTYYEPQFLLETEALRVSACGYMRRSPAAKEKHSRVGTYGCRGNGHVATNESDRHRRCQVCLPVNHRPVNL
jgi:hypothetical protein